LASTSAACPGLREFIPRIYSVQESLVNGPARGLRRRACLVHKK
jgi:hypothetical protein